MTHFGKGVFQMCPTFNKIMHTTQMVMVTLMLFQPKDRIGKLYEVVKLHYIMYNVIY